MRKQGGTQSRGMSSISRAWKESPYEYAQRRRPSFETPDVPSSVYVTMSDGTKLATDVYIPLYGGRSAEGQLPCILIFTPYYRRFKVRTGAKVEPSPGIAIYRDLFVSRGYVLVVVDVRGTGASFGIRDGFRSPRERSDFSAIADWVCAQSWSDGNIGAGGVSYLGASAEFLAGTSHPAVRAIAPLFSVWDTYADNYYPGGVQLSSLIEDYQRLAKGLDQADTSILSDFPSYHNDAFTGGPVPVDHDFGENLLREALGQHKSNYVHGEFMRGLSFREEPLAYDQNYSSATISPYSYRKGIREDVAIYSVSGWMDGAGYSNGAISRFLVLNQNPHHLMIGPWDHGARSDVSPWRCADEPDDFWWYEVLRFFDHYLMGLDTGLEEEEPIHYFTLHEEAWHSASSWPLANRTEVLKLGHDGVLLQEDPPIGQVRYQSDFTAGTGANTRYERIAANPVAGYYPDWQGKVDHHLVFESEPLKRELSVVGHPVLEVYISVSEADANLFIYLTEKEADGTERYVTEGLLRLLHRKLSSPPDSFPREWPYRSYRTADARRMVPGQLEPVTVAMFPVSWRFSAGSQILLSFAGHDRDHTVQAPPGRPPVFVVQTGPSMNRLELPVR